MRALSLLILCLAAAGLDAGDTRRYWPSWRGPGGTGVAPDGRPPATWSATENLRWRIDLPGLGHASPVVWGDRIYVLSAVPTERPVPAARQERQRQALPDWRRKRSLLATHVQAFVCLAVSRSDGSVLWRRTLVEAAPPGHVHRDASWASASPVTDGERVFAFFGSLGLFCLDRAGGVVWRRDFGEMDVRADFGEGASPALHGDRLVVNWDHEGESFLVCLAAGDGAELWRRPRDEVTSWSTPTIVEHAGVAQVIVAGAGRSRGYRLDDGTEIWSCAGMTKNVVPTPAVADGRVYLASGFRGNALQCIDLDRAAGEITGGAAVLWSTDRHTPYTPSPLVYEGIVYYLSRNDGIISARNATDGSPLFGPERLEGIDTVYASLVGGGGLVYVLGRNGTCVVLDHGPKLQVRARNSLEDSFTASPVVAGHDLILRGADRLYCLAAASR